MVDEDTMQCDYCWRQLANMRQLCRRFYTSGQTQSALEAAILDRDNIANAVRFAAQNLINVKTEDSDDDDGWWSLATIEGVTFLDEFLPADAYRALFDALQGVPVEGIVKADSLQGVPDDGDPTVHIFHGVPVEHNPIAVCFQGVPVDGDPRTASRRCRALSAAAYGAAMEERLDRAAVPAAAAYDLLPWVDDDARAFCLYCLAIVCRTTDISKAASLARRSLDVYRDVQQHLAVSPPERIRLGTMHDDRPSSRASKPPKMGVKAIHLTEQMSQNGSGTMHDAKHFHVGFNPIIHVAELLASILADSGAIQSALNACRQSDEAGFQSLCPGHPLTVRGYLVRWRLWATVGLMERARQAAMKAAEAAMIYYAEEHPQTGHALACLCESTSHRGPVDDSICDAIHALAVRIKV